MKNSPFWKIQEKKNPLGIDLFATPIFLWIPTSSPTATIPQGSLLLKPNPNFWLIQ